MPGRHNISNATAAIAVANRLGISSADIAKGLASFGGVKRRFTLTGEWNGVQIFDDFGHHPVEIKAVLKAAREACKGRVITVHQPHRYTRLSSLFEEFAACFNDADSIFLAPVYAAGEDPIEGVDSEALVSASKRVAIATRASSLTRSFCLKWSRRLQSPAILWFSSGAGNITYWAVALPKQLEGLSGKSA